MSPWKSAIHVMLSKDQTVDGSESEREREAIRSLENYIGEDFQRRYWSGLFLVLWSNVSTEMCKESSMMSTPVVHFDTFASSCRLPLELCSLRASKSDCFVCLRRRGMLHNPFPHMVCCTLMCSLAILAEYLKSIRYHVGKLHIFKDPFRAYYTMTHVQLS